jgi:hypothetical protein
MSGRLKLAIEKLTPGQVEQLTRHAEMLAGQNSGGDRFMRCTWAGGLADAPEQSGLEAQEAAKREMVRPLLRSDEE